ncbi:amidohydrolase [Lentibacter sp. XHP0401]|uniref:amidohydrolase n=1 Tax=Lentibacter sp. XHP0401 TaxID=2984334 RepID=UPI0021E8F598|nr:amidohydrolase [Lentibacter sp. XHP0401]MCV2894009.1 amidohydrolase [Lentibacter sp. XHP0401]
MSQGIQATPVLSNHELTQLIEWRRELHMYPEVSGEEAETAARVLNMLKPSKPDEVVPGLGGHGVAAVYDSGAPGPTVMLRCELDALPIEEVGAPAYKSTIAGKGHLCGHDGHMAILAAVAGWLGRMRPERGRVILLFQPAEEDGSGAQKVLDDPRFEGLAPDYAFALHNFPGLPLGHAALAAGPMNCASRGMKAKLHGRTSHASEPENGVSPAQALAQLLEQLPRLGTGGDVTDPAFSLATVTHARLGEPAFGVAPGYGEIWVTLRTQKDATMEALVASAEAAVAAAAKAGRLGHETSYEDVFHHCENDPEATALLVDALEKAAVPIEEWALPMRASEDFGGCARSAMFLLGSGTDSPSLHNPDYDFPDSLIETGARVFIQLLRGLCFKN